MVRVVSLGCFAKPPLTRTAISMIRIRVKCAVNKGGCLPEDGRTLFHRQFPSQALEAHVFQVPCTVKPLFTNITYLFCFSWDVRQVWKLVLSFRSCDWVCCPLSVLLSFLVIYHFPDVMRSGAVYSGATNLFVFPSHRPLNDYRHLSTQYPFTGYSGNQHYPICGSTRASWHCSLP